MKCIECKKNLPKNDFMMGKKACYKCVYKFKTQKPPNIKKAPINYCRTCSDEIQFDENSKKRQRNIFCSNNCALLGQREKSNNHWTRKIRKIIPLYPQTNFVA